MKPDVGFPSSIIPSASGDQLPLRIIVELSRMLFTAKVHSWIIILGMLNQAFRQSTKARRSVTSTRGHRRLGWKLNPTHAMNKYIAWSRCRAAFELQTR